eukprot:gene14458-biopygen9638
MTTSSIQGHCGRKLARKPNKFAGPPPLSRRAGGTRAGPFAVMWRGHLTPARRAPPPARRAGPANDGK